MSCYVRTENSRLKMKITTWNINGLKALPKPLKDVLTELNSDVIAFQEIKLSRATLIQANPIVAGFNSYFFLTKRRENKEGGYSGVGTFCTNKATPYYAEEGLSGQLNGNSEIGCLVKDDDFLASQIMDLEKEGRAVITCHNICLDEISKKLVVINVYCPRVDCEKPDREDYQMMFYKLLEKRASSLVLNDYHVIILGDFNCSHKRIDHCDPDTIFDFELRRSRVWLTDFLAKTEGGPNFTDTFRFLYPNDKNAFTCWNTKINARVNNYGTRLDYIVVDDKLLPFIEDCEILRDVMGSDHCPVRLTLKNCNPIPASKCPSICTKYWPELAGTQKSISQYLNKETSVIPTNKGKRKLSKETKITNFFQAPKKSTPNLETEILESDTGESSQSESSFTQSQPEQQKKTSEKAQEQTKQWKNILPGPQKAPKCTVHQKPCKKQQCKNGKNNHGRYFWSCSLPAGKDSKTSQCNFFSWM